MARFVQLGSVAEVPFGRHPRADEARALRGASGSLRPQVHRGRRRTQRSVREARVPRSARALRPEPAGSPAPASTRRPAAPPATSWSPECSDCRRQRAAARVPCPLSRSERPKPSCRSTTRVREQPRLPSPTAATTTSPTRQARAGARRSLATPLPSWRPSPDQRLLRPVGRPRRAGVEQLVGATIVRTFLLAAGSRFGLAARFERYLRVPLHLRRDRVEPALRPPHRGVAHPRRVAPRDQAPSPSLDPQVGALAGARCSYGSSSPTAEVL